MKEQEDILKSFACLLGSKDQPNNLQRPSSSFCLLKSSLNTARSRESLTSLLATDSDSICLIIPSLYLRKFDEDSKYNPLPAVGEHFPKMKMEASVLESARDEFKKTAEVEQNAASTLGLLTSWTKSSVVYASSAISDNIAYSFEKLVDSRSRSWALLLLKHSLTNGDTISRSRLLSMLASSIKVNTAEYALMPQPLPEHVANMTKKNEDPDVILPLLFDCDVKITVQSKDVLVKLRAPGTICATFDENQRTGLKLVDIRLDTGMLLESMVKEARMVVFNAVAKVTCSKALDIDTSSVDSLKISPGESSIALTNDKFRQPAHRSLKSNHSSHRINNILSTATSTAPVEKLIKSRSVQFYGDIDSSRSKTSTGGPAKKRQKQQLATTARLTSFKSFGRPHAGDFESVQEKNATFSTFGGSQNFFGRDGRLASRPKPMLSSEIQDILTSQSLRTANATFDVRKPRIHLIQGASLATPRKQKESIVMLNKLPISIPRTATALEGWLVEKARGTKR